MAVKSRNVTIKLDGIFYIDEIKQPLPKNKNYLILLRSNNHGIGHFE